MTDWKIVCEPDGKNDGINACGMVVYLTDGRARKEVGAAGFIRENSRHPDQTLDEALGELVAKAKRALELQIELERATCEVAERVMA